MDKSAARNAFRNGRSRQGGGGSGSDSDLVNQSVSSQISVAAGPTCWREVFECCCCSVLVFAWRSDKFLSSWRQRVGVPPEVVGVREAKDAASGLIVGTAGFFRCGRLGERDFRSAEGRNHRCCDMLQAYQACGTVRCVCFGSTYPFRFCLGGSLGGV